MVISVKINRNEKSGCPVVLTTFQVLNSHVASGCRLEQCFIITFSSLQKVLVGLTVANIGPFFVIFLFNCIACDVDFSTLH